MLLEDTPRKFERLHPLVIKVSKKPDSPADQSPVQWLENTKRCDIPD